MAMLNLTAAAEAIEDAYNSSPRCNDHVLDHKYCLAAAIRAAVAIVEFPPRHDADPLWNAGFDYAQKAVLGDLLAIADELDGIKYGTYRCNLKDKPSND
jgi:hypothetical protein